MKQFSTFISLIYFTFAIVAQDRALSPENLFPEDRFQYNQEIPPYRIPDYLYDCENNLLEVMFAAESQVRLRSGQLTDLQTNATQGLSSVLNSLGSYSWKRQSDVEEAFLDKLSEDGTRNTGQPVYNLNNIYRLEISGYANIWELGFALESLPGIIYARPVPKPQALPLPPNYQGDQGYLDPADEVPSGINALYAWTKTGGTGAGITICDLEYEWNYNHADVTKAVGSQINSNLGTTGWGDNHGTAVIGQLVANNNGWGITGASYGSSLRTCGTFYGSPNPSWNVSGAITLTIASLSAGDVILLEQQWDYTGSDGFVPIEWWGNTTPNAQTNNPVYAAIVNAVANGIHVVQAGGNGNVNTGNLTWFGNSGSVIVGAGGATATLDRRKLSFSSFGPRFDAQGWGHNVTTTGYGGLYSAEGKNYWYTSTFNGTSSASPIVTSAIASFAGYWRSNVSIIPPSPALMRTLLHRHGQLQVNPGDGNIGRRPDLKAMIDGHKYCAASGTTGTLCYEYISRVQMGSIDNISDCNNYVDYTSIHSTNLPMNLSTTITVTNGFPGPSAQCGIWIDWNRDGDFNDVNETYAVSGSPGNGPFTVTLTPPAWVTPGEVRVRVRVNYTGTMSACGTTTYGEVEDYTLNILPAATLNVWTGAVSANWHTTGNWSLGVIPNSTFHVEIPAGTPHQPAIGSAAQCNNLFLYTGATLTHTASFLDVYGTFDAGFGQYTMSGSASLYFMGAGNVNWWDDNQNDTYTSVTIWKSNADAKVTMRNNVICSNRLNIYTGKLELSNGRTLNVTSTATNALQVSNQGALILSAGRTLNIAGQITFFDGSKAEVTGGTIICGRNFRVESNTANDIILANTTLIMNGNVNQFIQDMDGGALRLHNLTVDKSGGKVYLANDHLTMTGNLLIENGSLSCYNASPPTASYNIKLAGDWTNNNFPAGFEPGAGRVIFNGPGHQLVNTDENFNILEANMVAALRIPFEGQIVTCNGYHWTSGGIDVFSDATFTALDLTQQGLTGGFWINPGGVINLYQDNIQWVDLDGDLYFNGGGTINVYGGNGNSWWAFSRNASLNMNGGVLDFKDNGITISSSSYSLSANLSASAVIRTTGGLSMTRPGFVFNDGTLEFYGTSDRTINLSSTNALHRVKINKSAKGDEGGATGQPVYDQKDGSLLSGGTRANTISLTSNTKINGILTIAAGTLDINGRQLEVFNDAVVLGKLKMTNALDVLSVIGIIPWLEFGPGSVAEITTGTINTNGWVITRPGSSVNIGTSNTISIFGDNGGGLANLESSASYGNVTLNKNPNHTTYLASGSTQPFLINGNLTINSANILMMQGNQLTVQGNIIDASNSQIYLDNDWKTNLERNDIYEHGNSSQTSGLKGGNLTVNSPFTLNGLLDLVGGQCTVNERFILAQTGTLRINGGTFTDNDPNTGTAYMQPNMRGTFEMDGGVFQMTNHKLWFGPTSVNSISGGTIRCGRSFTAENGVFQPIGGEVQFANLNTFPQFITMNPNNWFHNLVINDEVSVDLFDVQINGNLIIEAGSLVIPDFSYHTISVGNGVEINNGGSFNMLAGAELRMGSGKLLNVNNGASMQVLGTGSEMAKISRIASGYYTFNVNSGGQLAANNSIFEYMTSINIHPGAMISPSSAFNHSIFRNGQSGSQLLVINNAQNLTVTNANFPLNTWGGNFNVAKTENSGQVTFVNAIGAFAGSTYELDPFNRIFWGDEPLTHNISLPAGWNGLSSYIVPTNTNIVNVFTPVNSSFITAQTMTAAYYPAGGVNTIGNWANKSAYKVKMSSPAVLPIVGYEEPSDVFTLTTGWNLVPVIANVPVNVVSLFSGTSLVIAKDVAGVGIYWPAMGINTLGNLLPGSAYYALVSSPGSITFPSASKEAWSGKFPAVVHPAHPWNEVSVSPSSHLIAIEADGMSALMHGDVIGVFAQNGDCYGVMQINDLNVNALLTAYADDALTAVKDGFVESEILIYRVFRPATGEIFEVEAQYNQQLPHQGFFADEGLSAIKVLKLSATGIADELYSNINIYPNPTDDLVWITGITGISKIELVGSLGTIIRTIANDGQSELTIDLSDIQPGVYQVKLIGEKGTIIKRVVKN